MSLRSAAAVVPVILLNFTTSGPVVGSVASPPPLSTAAGQPRHDEVQGWLGAKWGMTVAQVAIATGRPLGEPVKGGFDSLRISGGPTGLGPDPQVTCYDAQEVAAANSTAWGMFCFGGDGETGLVLVDAVFKPGMAFASVKDYLTATYGKPSGSGSATFRNTKIEQVRWNLPATEIYLGDNVRDGLLTVTVVKRRPTP